MATVNGTANNDVLFIDKGKSNDTLLGLAGNDYLDALPGVGNNILSGGEGDDELYAYTNDQLYGDAGNDSLTSDGNGGNTLAGGDGNDTIYADRHDTVFGDAGDDKIYGGQGGNQLTGGAGKDVFWIANVDVPTTPNTIIDFDRLNDTIRLNLAGVKTLSDLTIAKSGSDATISFGTQQLALLKNTAPGSLNSNTVAVDPTAPNNAGSNVTSYEFTNLPKLGTTSKGQDLFLGGFSGLYFQGVAANGNLKFVTNTDRGPNGEPTGANRPFLLPTFQPEIVSFELNQTSGEISITKRTGLFRADGKTPLTGLPNLQAGANGLAYTDEIGVDLDGKVLPNDPFGADVEGIVIGPNGTYWLVDEYRPAIYQFDVNGKLLNRFIPKGTASSKIDLAAIDFGTEVLPEVYAQRRSNRGFEAVAIEGSKLYAFMQSPIDNPDNAGDTASRASRAVRILEFDTLTNTVTGEYLYLLDDITGTGNAKTDKLGDAVSLGNGKFAVVERDDLATTASNKLIYQIDLATATNIHNPTNFVLPAGKTIEQLTPAELTTAKITTAPKSLIANAAQVGYTGVEKLEGLALVSPNTLALINDNDFNVLAGSKVPEKLGILELSKDLALLKDIQVNLIANVLNPNPYPYPKPNPKPNPNLNPNPNPNLNPNPNPNLNPNPIEGFSLNKNLFTTATTFKGICINAVSQKAGAKVNEIGFFAVDDLTGKIGGIAPGTAGYLKLVADSAQPIFTTLHDSFFNTNKREISLDPSKTYQFFQVQDSSIADLQQQIASGKIPTNILFSLPDASGSSPFKITTNSKNDGYKISINNDELVLAVSKLAGTETNIPIGAKSQSLTQGRLIDLADPIYAGKTLKADIITNSDARYNNTIGFYAVEDAILGTIKLANGNTLKPGDANYAVEAIKSSVLSAGKTDSKLDRDLAGGKIYAPVLIAQGTLTDFISKNPTNSGDGRAIHAYFNYLGANPDKLDHFRLIGNNTFGVEDLYGGGDRDFNDVVVNVNIKIA